MTPPREETTGPASPRDQDWRLASEVAEEAGGLLLQIRREAFAAGWSARDTGAEGDRRSNELILARLAESRPGDAVLSEESADSPARLAAARVWIVDPLDGTREYSMEGRSDWAVHVALWERGEGLTAGAVAQPALGAVYATGNLRPVLDAIHPRGLPPGNESLRAGREPVILVSDSRPPPFAAGVARAIGAAVQPMGSAGAKAMAVVRREADAYLHAGGQWEWDSAAPVAVALSAGLHASRLDGSALRYNESRPYLPDLLICERHLAPALLAAIEPYLTP